MTVKLEGTIKRWIGASTDDKPIPGITVEGQTIAAADMPPGSSFLETDTGDIYRWDGLTWTLEEKANKELAALESILAEMRVMRSAIATIANVQTGSEYPID